MLIHQLTPLALKEAKEVIDNLLNGEDGQVIEFFNRQDALDFMMFSRSWGVIKVELVEGDL